MGFLRGLTEEFCWGFQGFGRGLELFRRSLFRRGSRGFGRALGDDLVLFAVLGGRDLHGDDGQVSVLGCGWGPE